MGVAVAACATYSETKTTLEPTTIHQAPTLAPDARPAESPTSVPILKPTEAPIPIFVPTPTLVPIQLRMTGFVVDAIERSATEIELLQVRDSNGRIWEFFTEGPIGIDAAHLRVHEETAEGVEVVYLEKDGSLVALEVNDIPRESAEIGFADAIIGDPGYLIGDGKVSSSPEIGSVYACNQEFRGGGAQHTGDWVVGDYWYPARKITVQGEVDWPNAQVSFSENNGRRVVTGNALPVGHPTGNFPIDFYDPAYQIDRNPNAIMGRTVQLFLPLDPILAATPSCVSMGMVGIALNGVAVYNALDDAGRDAAAHEVQDRCAGHPQGSGEYHYHGPGSCQSETHRLVHTLTGYAMDGFGLFGLYGDQGQEITNAELDECHGHTHRIQWNGSEAETYHYHLTNAYPYTVSCFRGSEVIQPPPAGSGPPPPRR